jgi:hypothetical protein
MKSNGLKRSAASSLSSRTMSRPSLLNISSSLIPQQMMKLFLQN